MVERLEDRWMPAGSPLVQPPLIQSVGGVLTATLTEQTGPVVIDPTGYNGFVPVGGTTFNNANTYQVAGTTMGLFPGPTLQVNPGERIDLTIVNGIQNVPGSTAFGPTNLHTHGLHVSQLGNSDNVFLEIEPGQSNAYRIQVPADHSQGLYWYHPHHHGFVNAQIFGGLSGLLVVGRPDGGAPELNGLTQQLLAVKNYQTSGGSFVDASQQNVNDTLYTVNGQIQPTIAMRPGETQVWNVANIGNNDFLSLVLHDPGTMTNLSLHVVAEDGNPLTQIRTVTQLDLAPGKRYSFLVQVAPGATAGTTYEFRTNPFFDGFNQWPVGSPTTSVTLATVNVAGAAMTPFALPAQLTPPNNLFQDLRSAPVAEQRTLVFNQGPDASGKFVFTINGQVFPNVPLIQPRLNTVEEWELINLSSDIHPFHIHQNGFQIISVNGVALNPNGSPITVNVAYPAGQPAVQETYIGGGLADVVDIPAFDSATGTPGRVVIRMRFEDFLGPYVYHCHRVDHEDLGMMGMVNILAEDPTYAVGQNAGRKPTVRVIDGETGAEMAQFLAFKPTNRGGVRVATGDVNGDGVYDILVGAGKGGRTRVKVIDGTRLDEVDRNGVIAEAALLGDFYAFSKSLKGGVFLAAGDINGDGLADVIVGMGRGQSRVKVVDATLLDDVEPNRVIADTALLANFLAYHPDFRGGVRVATGDINGDGRIDVVTGSGPGQGPHVKIVNGTEVNDVQPSGEIDPAALLASFEAFDSDFTRGVFVTAGNFKGFGYTDVAVGAGSKDPPELAVFSAGEALPSGLMAMDVIDSLFAYRPGDRTGVVVGSLSDPTHDSLVITPGSGNGAEISILHLCGDLACTPSSSSEGGGGHGH